MANDTEQKAIKESAVWAALGYLAKKRTARELLIPGTSKISVNIQATINGRQKYSDSILGGLVVAPDGETTKSESPKIEQVVAMLLDFMPEPMQAEAMASIKGRWDSYRALPDVTVASAERAKAWLDSLKHSSKVAKSGDLKFLVAE